MVKFFFNGQSVSEPIESAELNVTVVTEHENQTTLISYGQTLTFVTSAFEYLYSRRNDPCELINVLVQLNCSGNWVDIIKGVIFVTDCSFNELQCECRVALQDDGYSARIQNNKEINISFVDQTTKNGNPITAPADQLVMMFDPRDGVYYFPRQMFSVFECFKYVVSWMTDNTVTFESDYFLNGDGKFSAILSGYDVRAGGDFPNEVGQPPAMSFANLYATMRRFHNVGLGFKRDVNNDPVMIIEHISAFRTSGVAVVLDDVNQTELDFVQELLFAKIDVGSNIVNRWSCDNGNETCTAANGLLYYGFSQESFGFTGECNNDTNLDLTAVSGFVVDPNTIEDCLIYNNQSFDNDNFIIRWNFAPSPFKHAEQTDVLGTGDLWYNEYYSNKFVIQRYSDYLFGALLLYGLQYNVNLFKVEGTTPSGLLSPLLFPLQSNWTPQFDTTISDAFGVYQLNPINRFVPPNEGVYKIWGGVNLFLDPSSDINPALIVSGYFLLKQYDAGGVLLASHNSLLQFNANTSFAFPFWIDREFDWIAMDAGDYLEFSVEYWQNQNPGVLQAVIEFSQTVPPNHYLECRESRVVIRENVPVSGANRRIARTTTNSVHVPFSSMRNLLADTTKRIRMSNQRIDRTGWIDQMKFTFVTGETDVSMLND